MTAERPAAVELRGLSKRFGEVVANASVDLRIESGTIHGVVGENGAGKSTAMKMLYGIYQPDAGEIFVEGRKSDWRSPSDAIASGIGMVHQHFMLAGPFSALDNVLLGVEPRRWGIVMDRGMARARLETLAGQHSLPVDWERPVEELPVGIQQRIEILKLLVRDARILILDEPTSVLTPQEANGLFENLKRLRAEGKTIVLITHKLNEVISITDRVTVFRAGKVAGEALTSRTNAQELATLMVGRKVALNIAVPPARPRPDAAVEAVGLSLEGATGSRHRLSGINFSVKRGEIVGIAVVEGNAQAEFLQPFLHPRDSHCRTSGQVRILDQDVTNWDAAGIRALGVAVIPEDRHLEGLLLERPVRENFLLGLQRSCSFNRAGFLRAKQMHLAASRGLAGYGLLPPDVN